MCLIVKVKKLIMLVIVCHCIFLDLVVTVSIFEQRIYTAYTLFSIRFVEKIYELFKVYFVI